jgi:hypothetical protein
MEKTCQRGKVLEIMSVLRDTFDLCKQLQLPFLVVKGEKYLIIFDSTYLQFSPLNFP